MYNRCFLRIIIILFSIGLCFVTAAVAQNYQRDEEEELKDKENEAKYQEYLELRKEEAKRLLSQPISIDEIENNNLVEVEPNNILPSDLANTYSLVPYIIRRPKWGKLFSVMYSLFNPINYESDFVSPTQGNFEELYGSAQTPLLELSFGYKWNFFLGSLGGELSYGMYENDASNDLLGDATLSLQIIRAGLRYTVDNWLHEPLLAPYGFAGVYTAVYDEQQTGVRFDGTTAAAPYWGIGLLAQMGWLDKSAKVESYTESGIENTFLFAELRQFMASTTEKDPDFSTDLNINVGLSLEF